MNEHCHNTAHAIGTSNVRINSSQRPNAFQTCSACEPSIIAAAHGHMAHMACNRCTTHRPITNTHTHIIIRIVSAVIASCASNASAHEPFLAVPSSAADMSVFQTNNTIAFRIQTRSPLLGMRNNNDRTHKTFVVAFDTKHRTFGFFSAPRFRTISAGGSTPTALFPAATLTLKSCRNAIRETMWMRISPKMCSTCA